MSNYSIKDLEHLSGIKAHTLRIWEQRYGLVNPKRTETNIRYYDQDDLKLVLNVSLLKANGKKISKIAGMSKDEMAEAVELIAEGESSFEDQIHGLTLSMIDLDEARFNKIISSNSTKIGFEKTMINIVYPFLGKIGVMWLTDNINPAQEHFISHLIRQKLIVAIDSLPPVNPKKSAKFMLFLPSGELHELGLLFAQYLIRSRGFHSVYLGQDLPLSDLKSLHRIYQPDFLLTVFTSQTLKESPDNYVKSLAKLFPSTPIYITGRQVIGSALKLPEQVELIANPSILIEKLNNK